MYDQVNLEDELKQEVKVVEEENSCRVLSKNWKSKFWNILLPEEGKLISYWFGIAFDVAGILMWVSLFTTFLTQDEINEFWFMPLVGLCGATVAMSTPAGGGAFYFPVLTAIQFPSHEVVAFNLAIQTIGMGVFGTASWLRKSRESLSFGIIGICTISGWTGSLLSIFLPVSNLYIRIIFLGFSIVLLGYVVYLIKMEKTKGDMGAVIEYSPKNVTLIIITGFIGGIAVGYIGVGIGMFVFALMIAYFKTESRKAIGTSVVVMGFSALVPCLFHIMYIQDTPITMWLMTIGGTIVGARLGVLINKLFGRRRMMIMFSILLAIEIVRTPVELTLKYFVFTNQTL
eukprot:TRINITY_DN10637_c0_g1_i1.p1 TRINITY_DN10637_c0_g1~~TRINITY_DN10637_c0_g1_i1.p1  ORF type:complete len:343 (-),score=19.46 TRINITY_DN10637_c0_g1_i1:14-1042(-)